jgi:acyl-CoA thioesterase-1
MKVFLLPWIFFACAVTLCAQNPSLAPIDDEPGLPRVLLIGDSISIGYTLPVREKLNGIANVHRIPQNGGPTIRGIDRINAWLGKEKWDVIHFNFGLHDLKYIWDDRPQVSLEDYEDNLERLVIRMKKTGAKLVWCHTTPVPEGPVSPKRIPADVERYNDAAERVMRKHGVAINDLYSFALKRLQDIQRPVNVHFTEKGSEELASQVVEEIRFALAKPLRRR